MVDADRAEFRDADSFARALASRVASLRPALRDHLEDNFGNLLPHVFMGDVARWFLHESRSKERSDEIAALVGLLEQGLRAGPPDVRELIQTSFTENLPTDKAPATRLALQPLGPQLKSDYARYCGILLS